MSKTNKLLTVKEVSKLLGMSEIYVYLNQKKIPHIKMGRSIRFDEVEIQKWLKTKQEGK